MKEVEKRRGAGSGREGVPRAVVFDLGRVLLQFDFGIMASNLASRSRMGRDAILSLLDQTPLLHRYESGRMTTQAFFEAVAGTIGFEGGLEEFGPLFADMFAEIPELVAFHAELGRRGVPRYLFSNTSELVVEHLRPRHPFFPQFDGFVFSYEARAMKPDPASYAAVESVAGLRNSELLFIDDRRENVDAAAARGWRIVWQVNPAESVAEARQILGLPANG